MRNLPPIVYASVAGLLLGCSDSTGPSGPIGDLPSPSAFQVSPATVTLQPGQTFRLTTTYTGDPALMGTPVHVAWQSSNNNVVNVSGGLVNALSAGQARITAFWGGYQASALITVVGPTRKHVDAIPCLTRAPRGDRKLMSAC